jgi:hypothetical protein
MRSNSGMNKIPLKPNIMPGKGDYLGLLKSQVLSIVVTLEFFRDTVMFCTYISKDTRGKKITEVFSQ